MTQINPKIQFKIESKTCLYRNSYPESCHHKKNRSKTCGYADCPIKDEIVARNGYNEEPDLSTEQHDKQEEQV